MTRLSCDALFLRRVIDSMTRLQGPQQKHGRTPPCCGPLQSIEGENKKHRLKEAAAERERRAGFVHTVVCSTAAAHGGVGGGKYVDVHAGAVVCL